MVQQKIVENYPREKYDTEYLKQAEADNLYHATLDSGYSSNNSMRQQTSEHNSLYTDSQTHLHVITKSTEIEEHTQSPNSSLSDNMQTADKEIADSTNWRVTFDEYIRVHGNSADVEEFVKTMTLKELNDAANTLWETLDDFENCLAFYFALASNSVMVRFAIAVAKSDEMLNTLNKFNQSLLHVVVATCDADMVRLLYCKGGDLKHKDVWGNSPLHIAAQLGRAEVLSALTKSPQSHEQQHPRFGVRFRACQRKEDVNFINNDGKAPIHLAAEGDHVEALQVLAALKNVDVDLRRYTDGYSAAHIAVERGSMAALAVCLQNESDSEIRNCNGETPQQLAHVCNRTDMVALCQEHGASYHQLEFAVTDNIHMYEMQRKNVECVGSQLECMILESPTD